MAQRTTPSILHTDLDAFFVSMELLKRPELRGLPVIVAGGLGSRGVVSTCSYEARRFGVRSAMPVGRARQLCPNGVYIESDFSLYGPASKQFHAILRDFTPLVEPGGLDEAYLDVAGCERLLGGPEEIAQAIRKRVRNEIGIAVSVGCSTARIVSKVASDAAKPDGVCVVAPGGEAAFLAPRTLRDLPMIGSKTAEQLAALGAKTIGDVAALPVQILVAKFGPHGAELHSRCLGIDGSAIHAGRDANRSISREITFGEDEPDRARLRAVLLHQCERVAADLAKQEKAARTVTLKLRFPPFETVNRSTTPAVQIELAQDLFDVGVALFEKTWAANGDRPVRLIGIGVMNLVERGRQLRLGETVASDRLEETVAGLREKFGVGTLRRAAELRGTRSPRAGSPGERDFR